ncbi:MAG: decarboxylase [archaeon]|nr:decarboxylase [archaeon]
MNKPKFVISKSKTVEQFEKVKELADIVSYSSKTNQTATVILEDATTAMFSVHFANELKHVKDKSRVIFIAQAWSKEEIKEFIDQGISHFIVDNESDLDTLLSFLKESDAKVSLLLRVKLRERTIKTERYFVFGMNSETVNKRIREIRADKSLEPKIKELGIHFHRKTQNMSEWDLQYAVSNILENDTLRMIDLVDIGGGIPIDYANTNKKILPGIFKKIKEFREWLNERNIRLIIEPGRFISGPPTKLITTIIGIHENNIIVNASVYNTNLDALVVPVKLLVEGELSKDEGKPYVLKGATPCSMDLFRYRVYLNEPKVGDKIVFLNAGAYNFHSDFCDLELIETEIVD